MSEKSYNTNLASEFYALSTLHRLRLDAVLILGGRALGLPGFPLPQAGTGILRKNLDVI